MSPLYLKDGKLLLVNNALATNQNCCCPLGACCADDGSCSQTTEIQCDGTWHSGVTCESIDCTTACCEPYPSPGDCAYECRRGKVQGNNFCSECDPNEPSPVVGPTYWCQGGQPTSVTVTGSGFVANLGTPVQPGQAAAEAAIQALVNASYVVEVDCTGYGQASFDSQNYTILVFVDIAASRYAAISVSAKLNNAPFLNVGAILICNKPGVLVNEASCFNNIYECGSFSASYGDEGWTNGQGSAASHDFSGASINVS